MADYQPVDLSALCNAGLDVLKEKPNTPIGEQSFRGLPFQVNDDPSNCFIAFGAHSGSTSAGGSGSVSDSGSASDSGNASGSGNDGECVSASDSGSTAAIPAQSARAIPAPSPFQSTVRPRASSWPNDCWNRT